jgi:ABC-type multidrug transport system fused ATPase/permease subunit
MDEIVVLEAGRIVERGSFSTLLANKGLFAAMAAQQGISSP